MKQIIFVSSVQKEFAAERRAIRDFVEGDALLRRFFTVFLFEDLPVIAVRTRSTARGIAPPGEVHRAQGHRDGGHDRPLPRGRASRAAVRADGRFRIHTRAAAWKSPRGGPPQSRPPVNPEVRRMLRILTGEMTRAELMAPLGLKEEKHFKGPRGSRVESKGGRAMAARRTSTSRSRRSRSISPPLKDAGLVKSRREGRCAYYRVEPRGMKPLIDWIAHYRSFWKERVVRLEQLLEDMDG